MENKIEGTGQSDTVKHPGLKFSRFFTPEGSSAFDLIEWDIRDAVITSESGKVIFEQKNVEVPKIWSQLATNIVAQKYFHGKLDSPNRERSVKQLIGRVVSTLSRWGREGGYFDTEQDAICFEEELKWILANQYVAFNSPVWFNLGIPGRAQQASACFINSVQDSMESILDLVKIEGMLFKYGSGTGTNLSVLRSSREPLSGGGIASGPVSFMRGYDAFAGSIKSGGTTRRAAKMVILNIDHPDILEFIRSKAIEEKKAWALIDAGYPAGFNVPGGAYDSVQFQNANHSVRVPDEFMRAVEENGIWQTKLVTTGEVADTYKARDLFREIAEAAWICGDPGMQFDTTIQKWNCVPKTARINATNPCSEFVFVDDTACNLASLNLLKFLKDDGTFDIPAFKQAVKLTFTAQEIIVSNADYPTPKIAANSEALRPLGLGYANLGALLMSLGLPYDSDEGRTFAAAVTALMTAEAYAQSAIMAKVKGPFAEFEKNREDMLRVMHQHLDAALSLPRVPDFTYLIEEAQESWKKALTLGEQYGYRNAQATVIAPTGTIGLMMDCDTTGIEPDLALVKYKKLVGGGVFKLVNNTVPRALKRLGYSEAQIQDIVKYIDQHDTIEGAPHLKEEHLPVFDCAFKPINGKRFIQPMGHVRMMAAVQPFLSGSSSKTVNLPHEATVEDIEEIYMQSWKLGLKCIAIYRDGCKRSQPLSTSADDSGKREQKKQKEESQAPMGAARRRLPDERQSITHKFDIQGHEGYITVGLYPDGTPGEIFLTIAKEGSTLSGMMDAFATAISLALQYGVPLKALISKFSHMRFEPSGYTNNPQIPFAKSIVDYIFRWLAIKFLSPDEQKELGIILREDSADTESKSETVSVVKQPAAQASNNPVDLPKFTFVVNADAPTCPECGSIMVRNGACYKCLNCGATSGCS